MGIPSMQFDSSFTTILISLAGFIGAMTLILKQTAPQIIEVWLAGKAKEREARIKADEFNRTREQAGQIAIHESYGELLDYIREDREADRKQREADREADREQRNAELQRSIELAKIISDLTVEVGRVGEKTGRLGDVMQIHSQQIARLTDGVDRMERQIIKCP